jgi:hypothetical protein
MYRESVRASVAPVCPGLGLELRLLTRLLPGEAATAA